MNMWKSLSLVTSLVLTIIALLGGIAFYSRVQTPVANAQLNEIGNHDTCDRVKFVFKENPSDPACRTGQNTSTNSYDYEVDVYSNTGTTHSIDFNKYNFFCPEIPNHPNDNCLENDQPEMNQNETVPAAGFLPIKFHRTPTDAHNNSLGSFCGRYQMDFEITKVDNNASCHFIVIQNGKAVNAGSSGDCETGVACPGPTHNVCQSNACVKVGGPGADQCRLGTNDCQPVTHNECQNNACVKVNGKGTDQCQLGDNSVCQPQFHNICQNFACKRVAGPGADQCRAEEIVSPNCSHLTCVSNACTRVNGGGADQCTIGGTECNPPQTHLTVVKVVNNNHGGTKQPSDFTLRVSGTQVTTGVANLENPGDYTVSEDSMDGYHQVSISGDCDSTGHVHLNTGDNKTCVIENEDNGTTACTMPTCSTNIPGCSYPSPDTAACSCGPLVCITQTPPQNNITVNVQQQQQQEVLAASVAPAVQTSELPKTGAGAEVLLSLFGLLPLGWKLRKMV